MKIVTGFWDSPDWNYTHEEALAWVQKERAIMAGFNCPCLAKVFLGECAGEIERAESLVLELYCLTVEQNLQECAAKASSPSLRCSTAD